MTGDVRLSWGDPGGPGTSGSYDPTTDLAPDTATALSLDDPYLI